MHNVFKIKNNASSLNIIDLFVGLSFVFEMISIIVVLFASNFKPVEILLFINVFVLFFAIIIDLLIMGINKHFPIFAFYCCYFVFLLGRKLIQSFSIEINAIYNSFSTKFIQIELSGSDYLTFISLLYFSILVTFVFYKFAFEWKIKERAAVSPFSEFLTIKQTKANPILKIETDSGKKEIYRNVSFIMVLVTAVFAFVEKLIILKAYSGLSYVESYQVSVYVPTVIKIFNSLFEASVFICLASMPKKGKMWATLALYLLISGVLPVFNGNRAQFGTILLLAVCYLFVYYKFGEKKFKIQWLLVALISGLALIFGFWVIEQVRSGNQVGGTSFLTAIERILESLGGSDSVIGGIIVKADEFPKSGTVYLFYPIKAAIVDNPIARVFIELFTGQTIVSYPQGMDYLLHNDSFPHWFSYICSPETYLAGSGSGSAYIAECYFAFGFAGVMVFSAILGIAFAKIFNTDNFNEKPYQNAIRLFFLSYLFFLPRNSVFSFASSLLYFVFAILVCQFLTLVFPVATKKQRSEYKSLRVKGSELLRYRQQKTEQED